MALANNNKKNKDDNYLDSSTTDNTASSKTGSDRRLISKIHTLLTRRHGVGHRVLILIILFSSLVTLIATILQLYLDFQRDVTLIEHRLDEIQNSYISSISAGLWNLDTKQLQLQLEGIKRLPDIQAVELRETQSRVKNPLLLIIGHKIEDASIKREFPISYQGDDDTQRTLGTLYVEASLTAIHQRLFDKAIVILLSQGVKTFLVSLFILYIVYQLITRHLYVIANYLSKFNVHINPPTLTLIRKPRDQEDELDQVVSAFNKMCGSLTEAYQNLRIVNEELERDIIARQQAEDEIKRLNAELEQRVKQRTTELEAANKELGAFCYSVSHDLRAPLRRIEGFRRIIDEQYGQLLDEQAIHYLDRIEASTYEMSNMIDSFLELSRSTRGELTVQQFNLSKLAESIVDRLKEKEPSNKVKTYIQSDIYVDGDRRLLDLLLVNLIDNAWKYSRKKDHPVVSIGQQIKNNKMVYFVKDNGAGFDMDYASRLFTPFNRLHKPEDFEGTGIGLATAQRIIARHGGNIWAEAKIDQGAIFYFTLWDKEVK